MLDKLAVPLRLAFVSTFVGHFKSNSHLTSKIVIQPVEKNYIWSKFII